jgi:hypothetical protein
MAEALAIDFPADDFDEPDEPGSSSPRTRIRATSSIGSPRFVAQVRKLAPAVIVYACPNGGKLSDWQKIRRWREGATDGALDLELKWKPTRPGRSRLLCR